MKRWAACFQLYPPRGVQTRTSPEQLLGHFTGMFLMASTPHRARAIATPIPHIVGDSPYGWSKPVSGKAVNAINLGDHVSSNG